MDLTKLKEPFPIEKITWRVGATNIDQKTGEIFWGEVPMGIPLAYIDARDVMERLDAVCGVENWQNKHPHANGKTSCSIGIRINNEWLWKENGAGDSQVEAEKGAFSDAFKRSAVQWGIGRYLYDVPNIWIELEKKGKSYVIKNLKDARLEGALRKAEAILRGEKIALPDEAPAQLKRAFTETEMTILIDKIEQASDEAEMEYAKDLARAAYPRMDKTQKSKVTKAINTMTVTINNKTLDNASERMAAE